MDITTDTLKTEVSRLREALDRIARPIWWMQEDAHRLGQRMEGGGAIALANTPSFLSKIASEALAIDNSIQ
jgi:hypothetical protein